MLDTFLPHEYDDEPNILESEVRSAMKALPNNKTAGLDNIPIEFFKPPNEEIVRVFTILMQQDLEQQMLARRLENKYLHSDF